MRWSSEQISGWLFEQGIKPSHERIYQMIWQDKRDGGDLWRSLRRRGKRAITSAAGKNAGRGLIPDRIDLRFLTPSLTRKILCAGDLNPRDRTVWHRRRYRRVAARADLDRLSHGRERGPGQRTHLENDRARGMHQP
jgi:hypothetical protein